MKTDDRPDANPSGHLILTQQERDELRDLVQDLVDAPPNLLEDPKWIDAARECSCHLPVRLREAVRLFRADPGLGGVLRISGLPTGTVPATPTEKDSVERRTTVPAAALVLCVMGLGEPAAFRPEKHGALVQNVVPVPGRESSQSNAGSQNLKMHVENAFHTMRPDYVALSCLRNDHDGNAGLQVASVRLALREVPEKHQRILREARFRTCAPPSFSGGGNPVVHSVLDGAADDPNVRVDFSSTSPLDDEGAAAMDTLHDALASVRVSLLLAPGDLAVIDNRLVLHGRTAFSPRYDGNDRWLHRSFVHLDPRRTRELRTGGGYVID
ncbi:TauD/TfdA family dioxygenase [Streptomyces sp. NPDC002742]|uniref:TauD/TfdA family dioxygenase n=1 Tax=Streptomyces sp. NPDC002742 TaxID=3364663 RepID=UPI0036D142E3